MPYKSITTRESFKVTFIVCHELTKWVVFPSLQLVEYLRVGTFHEVFIVSISDGLGPLVLIQPPASG